MFTNLNVFRMAHAMAVHAGHRQAIVAQNVANSDTVGYRARDIAPFAQSYPPESPPSGLRASRPAHLAGGAGTGRPASVVVAATRSDPNGNSVSVEEEMLRAVDAKRQHDRALAIYKSSLNVLRTSLGRA